MAKELEEKNGKLDTQSMLESEFLEQFAKGGGKMPKSAPAPAPKTSKSVNANTEGLLLKAYDVRDNLISSFSEIKLGSNLATNLKNAINQMGTMIVELGGSSEPFDPLSHVSGLQSPNVKKYASRVIENTTEFYSLGKIENAKVENDGKSIIMTFAGSLDDIQYRAIGTISTEGTWLGTEAIDYIYTPGEGKMSVKVANQQGQWIDKSDNYSISWELFEGEPEKNIEKKAETKEEESKLIENNLDEDIIEDFPIEEK